MVFKRYDERLPIGIGWIPGGVKPVAFCALHAARPIAGAEALLYAT